MYYDYGKWIQHVLRSEVVLFLEVTNVLQLWEVDTACPLFRGQFFFREWSPFLKVQLFEWLWVWLGSILYCAAVCAAVEGIV